MRRSHPALALLLLPSCVGPPAEEERERAEWPPPTELGPEARRAPVVLPAAYDGREEVPLVLLLGGYDYLSADLDAWIGLTDQVDEHGFALLMPDGLVDEDGSPFWNATDTCCDFYGTGVDDAGWLLDLVEEATRRLAVDASRVVALGHSNGGFMAYRLACEPDSPLSALVSIAGSSWLDPDDCAADHPVSVLQVHGEDDDVMPIDGDDTAPGAREVVRRWASRADCAPGDGLVREGAADWADDGIDDETDVEEAEGCAPGLGVELWVMRGNDHYPEFRPSFAGAAVDWALSHPR